MMDPQDPPMCFIIPGFHADGIPPVVRQATGILILSGSKGFLSSNHWFSWVNSLLVSGRVSTDIKFQDANEHLLSDTLGPVAPVAVANEG